MDFLLFLQAIVGFLALSAFYNLWIPKTKGTKNKSKEAPESAGAWPIIGHFHLLAGQKPVFRTLGAMADKYGPAFTLRLGMKRALIVSSPEIVRECFTTNDKVLSTRPKSAAGKYLNYDNATFGLASYGPYWRELRKIATLELLSTRRLESLKHIRVTEINLCIKELYRLCSNNDQYPVKIDMQRQFGELMFNVVLMMIAGKRCFGSFANCDAIEMKQFQHAIQRLMHLSGVFVLSDALPFLRWIDLGGHLTAMKRTSKEIDCILARWVEEHRQKRLAGESQGDQDFMNSLLSLLKAAEFHGYDLDTVIKATPLALIIAGTDTTTITLTWALSLLMNNPEVLQKARAELDFLVGKDRQVDEADIKNLVYLQAIVKETLRLYPPSPLGVPRETMEDCQIDSFDVTAGTQVFVNIWKLHRDPRVWSNPLDFQPERFLTRQVDMDQGQHFEYIPFGAGRRSCAGMSFALHVLHLMLARLLHSFNISTPSNAPVDMSEGIGITMPKTTPLEVFLSPRLRSDLY